ncbi:MAG: hypothetical protein VCA17_11550, partial [Dehalococcoidia bacterium]
MTWTTLTRAGNHGRSRAVGIGFGIALILAFGIGRAGVLAGIGLALVYVRAALERIQTKNRLVGVAANFMPLATALVVLGSG